MIVAKPCYRTNVVCIVAGPVSGILLRIPDICRLLSNYLFDFYAAVFWDYVINAVVDLYFTGDPSVYGNLDAGQECVDAVVEAVQSGKFNGYPASVGKPPINMESV